MLDELFDIIQDRKQNLPTDSYTSALLQAGQDRILRKVNEEAFEVVMAAAQEGDQRLIEESADLIYHLWVLLASRDLTLAQVKDELARRHRGAA